MRTFLQYRLLRSIQLNEIDDSVVESDLLSSSNGEKNKNNTIVLN